jgi:hypothetical protein
MLCWSLAIAATCLEGLQQQQQHALVAAVNPGRDAQQELQLSRGKQCGTSSYNWISNSMRTAG